MSIRDPYQLEERDYISTIMPHSQQYQYHNQQNQSSPLQRIQSECQQYLVQTIVCYQPSRLAQTSIFQRANQQNTVTIQQYGGMQLENQRELFLQEQLNKQTEQPKKGSINYTQFTLQEEKKKQFDAQHINPTTPQKRKSKNLEKQSEGMTVQSNNELSNQKSDLHEKQLNQYKMMVKNQENKVLEYQQKLKKSQKKNKKLQQLYNNSQQRCKKLKQRAQNFQIDFEYAQSQNGKVHQMFEQQKQTVNKLQEKINRYQSSEQQKNLEIESLKSKVVTLQGQIKIIKEKKQQPSKNIQNLKIQYQRKIRSKDERFTLQIEGTKKSLQGTISQKDNQIKQMQQLNSKLQSEKKTIQATIKDLESALQKIKQQSRKLETQKVKFERQLKEAKIQNEGLNRNILSLDQQLKKEILSLDQQLKKEIQSLDQQLKKEKEFKKEKEAEKKQLQTQINGLNNKLKKNEQICAEKQKKYAIDIRQREVQISRQESNNKELLDLIQKYKLILKPICELSNLPFEENNINIGIRHRLMDQVLKGMYFQQSVILNQAEPRKRQFLFRQLTSFLSMPTFKSQLLFKYDPINPSNNFFNYILDRKNLLVLIKLINGTIIGGFTVPPFGKGIQRPGKGFIFSLTLQKSFKMKNQPKVPAIQNDTFFLIMGSSEIRIKYSEKKFFTNFGVAAATFDNNGFTKQQFLGVKEHNISELDFQTYQIYAVNGLQ